MAPRALPGLGLTAFWDLGADGWKPAMDANIRLLSALCQCAAKSRTTALPGSPTDGDIYIVPTSSANANTIAVRDASAWLYVVPKEGFLVHVNDTDEFVRWTGSAWETLSAGGGSAEFPDFTGNAGKILAVNSGADGVEWVDVGSGVGGNTTPASSSWRILFKANGGDGRVGVSEVEFRGVPGGPDLAVGGTPTAATSFTGTAANCFDGSLTTYWLAGGVVNYWVAYEFVAEVSINEVVLSSISAPGYGAACAPKDFVVQYFDSGSATWHEGWSEAGAVYTTESESKTFTFPLYEPPLAEGTIRITGKTTDHTLELTDAAAYVRMNVATANTLTVPTDSTVAFDVGTQIVVRQVGAGQTSIFANSGVTINSAETLKLRKQHSTATLIKVADNEWDLTGDLEGP